MKVDRRGNNLLSDGGCQRMTSFTGQGPGVHRHRIQPYTEFLNSLDQQAETPSREGLDQVLKTLRGSLQWEIRRRGLRDASPGVLGLVGYQRWWASAPTAGNGEGDALEELTTDCYVYVFIDRLRSLMAQLEAKGNVDGLVRRNVRNFVHDRQKRNDPLGFRVFRVFRRAAEESIAEQRLFVLEEHRRFYNDTLLGFAPDPEKHDVGADKIDLTPIVARWNDALLAELMTARGPRFGLVVQKFRARLLALEKEGLSTFRCRDIIEPLKADARKRWATLWRHGDGSQLIGDEEMWPMVATFQIDSDLDDRQGFTVLSTCIEKRLESFAGQQRTRKHLLKLWRYLKEFAMSDVESGDQGMAWKLLEDNLPSHRELSRTLEIPRERIPDLFTTIRRATQKCLSTSNSRGVWESPPRAVRRQVMKDRRDELLQSTGQAYRRLQQSQGAQREHQAAPQRPSVGKLYALPQSADLGVEWLAVERESETGCWLMIPGDPHPWLGSADWELVSEDLGPLTLRCGQRQRLNAKVFEDAVETASLTAEQFSALCRALKTMAAGDPVDGDPVAWSADPPWAPSDEISLSPPNAWSDSPGSNYATSTEVSLTSPTLDLTELEDVVLVFHHLFDIEQHRDYGWLDVSLDGGTSWQDVGIYSGEDRDQTWQRQEIPLPQLDGQPNVRFRFRLQSDSFTTADGWHLDDIALRGLRPVPAGLLFRGGFESGGVEGWSAAVP